MEKMNKYEDEGERVGESVVSFGGDLGFTTHTLEVNGCSYEATVEAGAHGITGKHDIKGEEGVFYASFIANTNNHLFSINPIISSNKETCLGFEVVGSCAIECKAFINALRFMADALEKNDSESKVHGLRGSDIATMRGDVKCQ